MTMNKPEYADEDYYRLPDGGESQESYPDNEVSSYNDVKDKRPQNNRI